MEVLESKPNPRPVDTAARRLAEIADSGPDAALDELTKLASQVCGTPMAFVSFLDGQRQWFKSSIGLDIKEAPRENSFCSHTVSQKGVFVVEDAASDSRFKRNLLVTSSSKVRFYAGVPLLISEGTNTGTLSVLDRAPRHLDPNQLQLLQVLARQISAEIELRRKSGELSGAVQELNQTAIRLRDSEAFYSTLVETLPQNILRKDSQGRFTFANRRFCSFIGKPLAEILGQTDFDLFPVELASKYHADDVRVMETLENLDITEEHQTPAGEKFFVHVVKTPLYDALGRVVGVQGIFWDVTQRQLTEEALAYERDLLRALLENIPDRIYFKDVNSRFLRCSASMIHRLGLSNASEVIGKTDFDFHPRELAREFFEDEKRIIVTGQPLINKLERQFSWQGAEVWASVTKVPIYSKSGAISGIIGISRDVTQLKQAELALKQARDAALESARVKSEFLANMSHEIRTPMNAITGMTGLLLDTRLNQEQRDYAETIRSSTDALLSVINDVLDFSKMEAGKLTFEVIDFELRECVEGTVEMLAEGAQKKDLELACWIDPDVPNLVRSDPGRIRQVLANLLSNAIKFTERGEVLVRVTKMSDFGTSADVKIAVQDTGVGIAQDALSVIFDAFTQADGSTTRKFGGSGLGLTISRQLVRMMNGEIGVESVPGQGSTFWFKLPFQKQALCGNVQTIPDFPQLASRRVLVVDDTPTYRNILHEQLNRLKMVDFYAGSGTEAMNLLRGHAAAGTPFDLTIIDTEIPDTDGLTLAQSIQGYPELNSLRVIMLTGLHRRLSTTVLQTTGIAACLVKPVRQSRLFDTLVDVLAPESSPRNAADERASSAPRSGLAFTEIKDVRVLIAEDNAVNQRLALRQLKKLGYYADAVSNGKEVLEALRQVPYDIILMDCQMPEMDGYEVSRAIRQQHSVSRPYIIALTANALQGDRERCLQAGMNDYLTKPLQISDLESSLQRALLRVQPVGRPRSATALAGTLDPAILASLRELSSPQSPDPLHELIELFLKDARVRLQKLALALEAKDWSALASTAHTLKGSANNLGARQLASLLSNLENCAKAANHTDSADILLSVRSEFQEVETALLAELQK